MEEPSAEVQPLRVDDLSLLSNFENKANKFCDEDKAAVSKITKNVQSIRDCWVVQKNSENEIKEISSIREAIKTSTTCLDDFKSGEPARIIKGCLSIAQSVSDIIGGPYGAAASAICGILGAILTQSSSTKPDMATRLIKEVQKEIQREFRNFDRALQYHEFSGLETRIRIMVEHLKNLQYVSRDEAIPDKILYETNLPHFTGVVAHHFTNCGELTNEEECKNCVSWVVLYCKAQTAYIVLLSIIITAFKCSGRETESIERQLEIAKAESVEKLAFLSDQKLMRKKGHRNQIRLAFFIRRNNDAYRVIEGYRESLGMEKMPSLEEIGRIAVQERHGFPEEVIHLYPRPHAKYEHHYFQLINHTDFPIQVKCGDEVGRNVNLLQFTKNINPKESYEHAATTSPNGTFSTGGVFVVYFESQVRSAENMLENDGSRMKVFEFALSKPFKSKAKSYILDMSDNFSPLTKGQTCWKRMNEGPEPDEQIYFEVDGLSYIVFTAYSSKQKKKCQTCRFVVQNYNPENMRCTFDALMRTTKKIDVDDVLDDSRWSLPRCPTSPWPQIEQQTPLPMPLDPNALNAEEIQEIDDLFKDDSRRSLSSRPSSDFEEDEEDDEKQQEPARTDELKPDAHNPDKDIDIDVDIEPRKFPTKKKKNRNKNQNALPMPLESKDLCPRYKTRDFSEVRTRAMRGLFPDIDIDVANRTAKVPEKEKEEQKKKSKRPANALVEPEFVSKL